jgi:hypothetical protein
MQESRGVEAANFALACYAEAVRASLYGVEQEPNVVVKQNIGIQPAAGVVLDPSGWLNGDG